MKREQRVKRGHFCGCHGERGVAMEHIKTKCMLKKLKTKLLFCSPLLLEVGGKVEDVIISPSAYLLLAMQHTHGWGTRHHKVYALNTSTADNL